MTSFLLEQELNKLVPSIFATSGANHLSENYGFVRTLDVVRGLKDHGFHPVFARQSKARDITKSNYAKHMMRFRHESQLKEVGGAVPEIVLVNSHDGSTSYQLRAGIFRLVCKNGMVVGHEMFQRKVKHQGNIIEKVVHAADELIEIVPMAIKRAGEWSDITLTDGKKHQFAREAAELLWDEEKADQAYEELLRPKRGLDYKNDLWTVFNVIQENLVRGGVIFTDTEGKRHKTRGVNSVNENIRLNTRLWNLTEQMAIA